MRFMHFRGLDVIFLGGGGAGVMRQCCRCGLGPLVSDLGMRRLICVPVVCYLGIHPLDQP